MLYLLKMQEESEVQKSRNLYKFQKVKRKQKISRAIEGKNHETSTNFQRWKGGNIGEITRIPFKAELHIFLGTLPISISSKYRYRSNRYQFPKISNIYKMRPHGKK